MFSNGFEMTILVGNKPIEEYYHEGSGFIEGRKGSEYTLRLRNTTGFRACFVVSIDGLSVLNGEEAGNQSPGYVVEATRTLDLSCYKVDDNTGARFVFGAKDKSYSAEIGKGTNNVGVIAAHVFREKVKLFPQYPVYPVYHYPLPPFLGGGWQQRGFYIGASISSNNASGNSGEVKTSGGMIGGGGTSSSLGMAPSCSASNSSTTQSVDSDFGGGEEVGLGTSFGDAMVWQTQTVRFERESEQPSGSLVLYYDTRKNLERRGIEFKKKVPPLPNPFPGNGCPTPPDWKK